jgi:hypothetical protein
MEIARRLFKILTVIIVFMVGWGLTYIGFGGMLNPSGLNSIAFVAGVFVEIGVIVFVIVRVRKELKKSSSTQ